MDGREDAVSRLTTLLEGYEPVAASAMTVLELHHGIARVDRPAEERTRIRRALQGIPTYAMDHEIAGRAGEIDGNLAAEGQAMALPDVVIAATALAHGLPVLTGNPGDFERVDGLDTQTY